MARTVTRLELVNRAKEIADMESDPFITDAQWNDAANRYLTEVYDLLVQCAPPDYYAADYSFQTVAGTIAYALPSDFRTMSMAYVELDPQRRRPLVAMQDRHRLDYQAPTEVRTIRLEYIPAPPVLTADSDTFDGVSGWEELVSALMARFALQKTERDLNFVNMLCQEQRARIRTAGSNRDRGGPRFITDLDSEQGSPWWWNSLANIRGYRLRGGNLEIYSPQWGPP
jgi:hypothetical protein